jgi:hypothetical protein
MSSIMQAFVELGGVQLLPEPPRTERELAKPAEGYAE